MKDRQDLILYIAALHANTVKACARLNQPRGFCEVKLRLMTLRKWVYDYRLVLDHFFDVKQLGYSVDEDSHDVSTLIPKNVSCFNEQLDYVPPLRPDDGIQSKVFINQQQAGNILHRLEKTGRHDLRPAVEWLLQKPEHNFIFARSGKLKLRDTSIWPVQAVETWPSWLREALFGDGIDIDSAYTQYLVIELNKIYTGRQQLVETLYPDLIRSTTNKTQWRNELCELMGLDGDEGISIVKKVCMSLANGSRISPAIMTGMHGFSITPELIISQSTDVSVEALEKIGSRLQAISKQYRSAKKAVCLRLLELNPSKKNIKMVFADYFRWEREARYKIWEACDHHGIMVHDGIDGIPQEYLDRLPSIIEEVGLKLT